MTEKTDTTSFKDRVKNLPWMKIGFGTAATAAAAAVTYYFVRQADLETVVETEEVDASNSETL